MQWVGSVGRLGVLRFGIHATQHREAAARKRLQQLITRAQAQVFGQVGQNQPALAAWHQVLSQTGQKTQQHAAGLVIHRVLNGRAGTRR